ncbi:ester cyclase [Larkinella sp. VNQ87]|uniref:ester cyclase n=1 Tax=Larkinella sp. VNQ87 TaxID=3400921 RepID=UPI003C005C21
METQDLISLAKAYMQVWNSGNDQELNHRADEDLEVWYTHFEQPCNSLEAYRQVLRMTYSFFPDLRIDLLEVIPAGHQVTVRWQYTGTHQQGTLFGVEPNQKQVCVSGLTLLEFNGSRVRKEYGIVDNLSLLIQLGAFNA